MGKVDPPGWLKPTPNHFYGIRLKPADEENVDVSSYKGYAPSHIPAC